MTSQKGRWSGALSLALAVWGCGGGPMVADGPAGEPPVYPAGVSTLAGAGEANFVDATGTAARFDDPVNVAVGPDGLIYVADFKNDAIRRVTVAGQVSTLARGLTRPFGLTFDGVGRLVVSGDDGIIRRLDLRTAVVTVIAQGLGLARGVAALPDGALVVTALDTNVVWLVQPDGSKEVLAGSLNQRGLVDGIGVEARFDQPVDVVLLTDGTLAVADLGNDRIRRVTTDGVVGTLLGTTGGFNDGAAAVAQLDGPSGLAADGLGNLYVTDRFNYRIRVIGPDGVARTVAGDGIQGSVDANDPLMARFTGIEGIAVAASSCSLYVADGNALVLGDFNRVRLIDLNCASVP